MQTNNESTRGHEPAQAGLNPVAGAGMGLGVGAALTAATGDGLWIGAFAGFGAAVALFLSAGCRRRSRSA